MKDNEAQAFIQQLEQSRYSAEIVPTKNRGKKRSAVRITLKAGQRIATIKQPGEWASVQQAWRAFEVQEAQA